MRNLHLYMDEELAKAKSEKDICNGIKRAFDRLEKEIVDMAEKPFKMGYPKVAYTGSCALVAVVKDDKVYVANSGDCKGLIFTEKEDGELEHRIISKTFSANKKYEQERLKA
jgi:pyruvate dehydrogenase phosphatase